MSHQQQRNLIALVKENLPEYFEGSRVLEIGSLDINGSIRSFFSGGEYTGIDVADGKGVDRVISGQLADYATGSFDVCISCECMEHNPWWRETMANMFRMTREGGLVLMTCAGPGRLEHGTTRSIPEFSPLTLDWDYYTNVSARDVQRDLALDWWFGDFALGNNWSSQDTYLVGLRSPSERDLGPLRKSLEDLARSNPLNASINKAAWQIGGEFGCRVVRSIRNRLRAARN